MNEALLPRTHVGLHVVCGGPASSAAGLSCYNRDPMACETGNIYHQPFMEKVRRPVIYKTRGESLQGSTELRRDEQWGERATRVF